MGHGLLIFEFLDNKQRCSTVGSTTLDEWLARRTDLYLTTHNTHNRQTSMDLAGFEPAILVGERSQTHALLRDQWERRKKFNDDIWGSHIRVKFEVSWDDVMQIGK